MQTLACPVCLETTCIPAAILLILHLLLKYTPRILLSTYEVGEMGFQATSMSLNNGLLRLVLNALPSGCHPELIEAQLFQGFTLNRAKGKKTKQSLPVIGMLKTLWIRNSTQELCTPVCRMSFQITPSHLSDFVLKDDNT